MEYIYDFEPVNVPALFRGVQDMATLKAAYHAAAMQYHPDRGGDHRTMQEINAMYTTLYSQYAAMQNAAAAADPTGKVKPTTEAPEEFIAIISALCSLRGLMVELCGRWIWITGDTLKHKDALKAAGCRWSSNKKAWYWHHPEEGDRWSRGKRSMTAIRQRYGSTLYGKGADPDALPA